MEIKLIKLILSNFKGFKDLTLDFGKETDVYGVNESGKTTIFDAFNWLLFNKDSKDKMDFNIKTLGRNNNVIHGLEHSVEAVLEVDGAEVRLKKLYKEVWTKPTGQMDKVITGHTTDYWVDGEPHKKNEYDSYIKSLVREDIFKLVTNPLYFNTHLKWKERRELLEEIAGVDTDAEILESSSKLKTLKDILAGRSISSVKSNASSQIRGLNKELQEIPVRISELSNSLPDLDLDFESIEKEIAQLETKIVEIDKGIRGNMKHYEKISKQQEEVFEQRIKLKEIEHRLISDRDKPLRELKQSLDQAQGSIDSYEINLKRLVRDKENLEESIDANTAKTKKELAAWYEEKDKQLEINDEEFVCPTCEREFEEEDIESKKKQLEENFASHKKMALENITERGTLSSSRVKEDREDLEKVKEDIGKMKAEKEELESQAVKITQEMKQLIEGQARGVQETDKEYLEAKATLERLEGVVDTNTQDKELEGLALDKKAIEDKLDTLKAQSYTKVQHEVTSKRIKGLKLEERELAQKIADFEKEEFLCEEFTRTKARVLEDKINDHFKVVKFKLFNTLVNGGVEECCETLVNGVPFADVNTGSRVKGGVDIINTLADHYSIKAPIFIDNSEGITEDIETKAQVVNLIVSKTANRKKNVQEIKGTKNNNLYVEVR